MHEVIALLSPIPVLKEVFSISPAIYLSKVQKIPLYESYLSSLILKMHIFAHIRIINDITTVGYFTNMSPKLGCVLQLMMYDYLNSPY